MEQYLASYVWFTGLLFVTVLAIDILLIFKFRSYFQIHGFGIVTMTLVSFVISHAVGTFTFGVTAVIVMTTNGESMHLFYPTNNVATFWLLSSSLFHISGLTIQRVLSLSFGSRFVILSRTTSMTIVYFLTIWMTTFFVTSLSVTSSSPRTSSVFSFGFLVTGSLTVFEFLITANISKKIKTIQKEVDSEKMKKRSMHLKQTRRTFSLFSGLIFSFTFFSLPTVIPSLIFSVRDLKSNSTTILVISLWILIGVVFNNLWIFLKLRTGESSRFYARWSLQKSRENLTLFLLKVRRNKDISRDDDEFLLDSECEQTEHEFL